MGKNGVWQLRKNGSARLTVPNVVETGSGATPSGSDVTTASAMRAK